MHVQPTGLGQRFVIPQRARFPMDAFSSTPNIAILGAMPTHMGLVPLLPQCSPRLLSLPSLHHALAPVLQPPVLWGAIPPVPPTSQRPSTAGPPATPARCESNGALTRRPKHRGRSGWRVQGADMGRGFTRDRLQAIVWSERATNRTAVHGAAGFRPAPYRRALAQLAQPTPPPDPPSVPVAPGTETARTVPAPVRPCGP